MKILFVLPSLGDGPGGSEKVMMQIASALADRDTHDISLLTLMRREYYLGELHENVNYESANARRALTCVPLLASRLRSNEYDVVICSAYANLVCGLARVFANTRSRVIARETTIPSIGVERWRFPALIRALYRYVYPRFDGVICQSEDMAEDLSEFAGVSRSRMRVIYNPYFPALTSSRAEGGPTWFSSSDYPDDIVLTAIGKFTAQKNFMFALKALANLADHNWRLNLVGDGPERLELENAVVALGLQDKVAMHGVSNNVAGILSASDYLLLVSRFEGLSNVMIEAICNRVPIVATPFPGGLLEVAGRIEECLIADAADIDAFQKVLSKCRKGVRIDPRHARNFDIGQIADGYLDFARSVIEPARPVRSSS